MKNLLKPMKSFSTTFMKIFGIILFIFGSVGLFYGPCEIYCFYIFSKGGMFYYEGFQFGSLWFAYLTIQNAAYYIIAFLLIPIGIGTYKLDDWARKLSLNLFFVWIILGISLTISFIFGLPGFMGETDQSTVAIIFTLIAFLGIVIPLIFIKIYKSNQIKAIFKNHSQNFLKRIPQELLLVCSISIFFI
jgi:hypothetical protein